VVSNLTSSIGYYLANLNLTISNHKNIEAEIVVEISNSRGDNSKFTWNTLGLIV